MTTQDPGPLDWRVSIVDSAGRPSPEFQRRWNQNRTNTAQIGSITFGSGPPSGTPSDGAEYADTSTTPFTLYIGVSGAWNKAGVTEFIELSDVPDTYTGDGHFLVRVNSSADGLEFVNPVSVVPQAANPTATASDTAVNGTAATFMRSDAAPAVELGSASAFGVVKVDGTTITAASGVISSTSSSTGANPTATASDTAVNGSATTFMRSDAAPAVQKGDATHFGVVKVDGTTITSSGGVISSTGGGGGGGSGPNIRGSNITTSSSGSYTINFPTGSSAGDLALLFAGHGFGPSATPAGWITIDLETGSNWNGVVYAKGLTAADITTGHVVLAFTGSFDGCLVLATFVGLPYTIRNLGSARNGTGATSVELSTATQAPTTTQVVIFMSNRANSVDSVNFGTKIQQQGAGSGAGALYAGYPSTLGGIDATFTYGTAGTGNYQIILALDGAP